MTNFIFNSEINFLNKYYDKCFSIFKLKSYFYLLVLWGGRVKPLPFLA